MRELVKEIFKRESAVSCWWLQASSTGFNTDKYYQRFSELMRVQKKIARRVKISQDVCGGESQTRWWTDGLRHRNGEWRVQGISYNIDSHEPTSTAWPCLTRMIRVAMETGKTRMTHLCSFHPPSTVSDQNECGPGINTQPYWQKINTFVPSSHIWPVNCNISIHKSARAALILPVCVSVHVWGREKETLHWTKAAQSVWTAPLKQSLFSIQTRRRGESWLNTGWMSVEDGELVVVWFSFL